MVPVNILYNEFLKFDKFSSEKTLYLIDIESTGRVENFSLANTGLWSEIFVVITPDDSTCINSIAKDVIN